MEPLIKVLGAKLFANEDIEKLCEKKVKIILYRDLQKYSRISDVLEPHGAVIILYEFKPDVGHWCALIKHPGPKRQPPIVEFFDPLGVKVDGELRYIDRKFRESSGQSNRYLSILLDKALSDREISTLVVNKHQLQAMRDDVNTCGRWCGMRVAMRGIPLQAFIDLFIRQRHSPDFYITALTVFV